MKRLYLEDLKDMTEAEVKEHLAQNYASEPNSYPTEADIDALRKTLKGYEVLVAYESVGSWGCDSSSYFLLRNKASKKFYEVSGSHCSCYGFEGQFDPQEAEVDYLKSDRFEFWTGGYDDNSEANVAAVVEYMSRLRRVK